MTGPFVLVDAQQPGVLVGPLPPAPPAQQPEAGGPFGLVEEPGDVAVLPADIEERTGARYEQPDRILFTVAPGRGDRAGGAPLLRLGVLFPQREIEPGLAP